MNKRQYLTSRSLIFEVKSIGSELVFMRVLRLGLGNARAVSAFVTVCKFGRSLITRENVSANFRVFVHVTSSFACGSCRLLLLLVQL